MPLMVGIIGIYLLLVKILLDFFMNSSIILLNISVFLILLIFIIEQ